MDFLKLGPKWTREPKSADIQENRLIVITQSGTDLWARTYYGIQNDNAPVFQIETAERNLSCIL